MYRNWDEIPFLVFLSEKEYQTVRELMEKGRNGTITQEESDLVDIVDTLEASLWCFLNTDNYEDCVLKAVNLGNDTDTVACVAGSLAGLYYSYVPTKWESKIRNKKLVDKIINSFAMTCLTLKSVE